MPKTGRKGKQRFATYIRDTGKHMLVVVDDKRTLKAIYKRLDKLDKKLGGSANSTVTPHRGLGVYNVEISHSELMHANKVVRNRARRQLNKIFRPKFYGTAHAYATEVTSHGVHVATFVRISVRGTAAYDLRETQIPGVEQLRVNPTHPVISFSMADHEHGDIAAVVERVRRVFHLRMERPVGKPVRSTLLSTLAAQHNPGAYI